MRQLSFQVLRFGDFRETILLSTYDNDINLVLTFWGPIYIKFLKSKGQNVSTFFLPYGSMLPSNQHNSVTDDSFITFGTLKIIKNDKFWQKMKKSLVQKMDELFIKP